MKRKLLFLFVGFFACNAIAWLCYSPNPAIRFIEFRNGQYPGEHPTEPIKMGRVAVFRITNDSRAPYSFEGYGPSLPFYTYRIPDPSHDSGWYPSSPRRWGGVVDTIAPHATLDIQVPVVSDLPFAIGIDFERGTAEQFQSRNRERSSISRFYYWLRCQIDPKYWPEPTWSTVAQAR